MSTVLTFFKEQPLWNDDLHKILSKIPEYEAQLVPIRQAMLGCCGASLGKNGKLELSVVDLPRWDALAAQEAAIKAKLQKIDDAVKGLDAIFDEVAAAGIDCPTKTPRGLWERAPRSDPPYQEGEYINAHGKRVDRLGQQIKEIIDPRFVAWNERAERAMNEAGR